MKASTAEASAALSLAFVAAGGVAAGADAGAVLVCLQPAATSAVAMKADSVATRTRERRMRTTPWEGSPRLGVGDARCNARWSYPCVASSRPQARGDRQFDARQPMA